MKKSVTYLLGLFLGLSLFSAPAARAWKVWQHQVIAEIAETHLQPEARREVAYLLGERFRMADEAGWADYIRGYWWWTAPWHYINWTLELEEPDYDVFATRRGNVVSAIENQLEIYRDRKKSRQNRLEALKFIIHFVGDVHQPLHCGKGEDRGGNDVPVRFQGKLTNLHACWDGTIYDDRGDSPAEHARRLQAGLEAKEREQMMSGRPYDWAVESHQIAREFVYPRLADLAARDRKGLPPEISGPYAEAAQPIMRRRFLEGGLRLAYLLNETGEVGAAPKVPKPTPVPSPKPAEVIPDGSPPGDAG